MRTAAAPVERDTSGATESVLALLSGYAPFNGDMSPLAANYST